MVKSRTGWRWQQRKTPTASSWEMGAGIDGAQIFDTGDVYDLRETLQRYRMADLMRVTGLPRQAIYDLRAGKRRAPTRKTLRVLIRGFGLLDSENGPALTAHTLTQIG